MRIEAIVADLDGTLVAHDSSISAATMDALTEIQSAGIPFVIATGRAPVHLREFSAITRHADIIICCSGAIGFAGPRRLWKSHLTPAAVNKVIHTAGRYDAGVAGFDGTEWYANKAYRMLRPTITNGNPHTDVTGRTLSSVQCIAMAVIHTGDVLMEISRLLAGHVRAGLSQVAGGPVVDITSSHVDKGTGVLRALDSLGAEPSAAVSFGDMPNDIPMFAVTGCPFAVGGGHPAVTAAVRETLDPVGDDGFARKIFDLAASHWRLP